MSETGDRSIAIESPNQKEFTPFEKLAGQRIQSSFERSVKSLKRLGVIEEIKTKERPSGKTLVRKFERSSPTAVPLNDIPSPSMASVTAPHLQGVEVQKLDSVNIPAGTELSIQTTTFGSDPILEFTWVTPAAGGRPAKSEMVRLGMLSDDKGWDNIPYYSYETTPEGKTPQTHLVFDREGLSASTPDPNDPKLSGWEKDYYTNHKREVEEQSFNSLAPETFTVGLEQKANASAKNLVARLFNR